LKLMIIWDY